MSFYDIFFVIIVALLTLVLFFLYKNFRKSRSENKLNNSLRNKNLNRLNQKDKELFRQFKIYIFILPMLFFIVILSVYFFEYFAPLSLFVCWSYMTFFGLRLFINAKKSDDKNLRYLVKSATGGTLFLGFLMLSIFIATLGILVFHGYQAS